MITLKWVEWCRKWNAPRTLSDDTGRSLFKVLFKVLPWPYCTPECLEGDDAIDVGLDKGNVSVSTIIVGLACNGDWESDVFCILRRLLGLGLGFWSMLFMVELNLWLTRDLEFDLFVTITEDSFILLKSSELEILMVGSIILLSVLIVSFDFLDFLDNY